MEQLFDFLSDIEKIVNEYEEEKKNTSDDYNLFSLLNRETDEVLTHSAIIADLLDPRGKHGLGKEPLNHFLQMLELGSFNMDLISCIKEKSIGPISNDFQYGGRIDIYVTNHKEGSLLIENKIFATEQTNQLRRYHNFDKNATIVYLTLEGNKSSDKNLPFEYKRISYRKDIISWIDKCISLSYNRPRLQENLKQYRQLIMKITKQNKPNNMSIEIQEVINANLSECQEIHRNFIEVIKDLKIKLLQSIFLELQTRNSEYNFLCLNRDKVEPNIVLTNLPFDFEIIIKIKLDGTFAINVFGEKIIELLSKHREFNIENNLRLWFWFGKKNDEDFFPENVEKLKNDIISKIDNLLNTINSLK